MEHEITRPVRLTEADGSLNPGALGFTRTPLHDTSGIGARGGGRRHWGRTKRWEYWNVLTPRHILSLTISHVDYLALHEVWLLDRDTGEEIAAGALVPFGLGATLPGTLGESPARARAPRLELDIEELGAGEPGTGEPGAGGTRVRGAVPRLSFDLLAERPAGCS